MRRREVLAGLGSVGVVAGAGAVAAFGVPSFDDDSDGSSGLVGRQHEPYEIETVDAPGSEAGTVTVPAPDQPTFIDFFATWCDPVSNRWTPSPRPTTESATTSSFCPSRANRSATRFPRRGARRVVGRKRRRLDDRPRPDLGAHQPILGIAYPSAVAIDASGPSGGTIPASKPPTNSSRESNAPLEGGAEGGWSTRRAPRRLCSRCRPGSRRSSPRVRTRSCRGTWALRESDRRRAGVARRCVEPRPARRARRPRHVYRPARGDVLGRPVDAVVDQVVRSHRRLRPDRLRRVDRPRARAVALDSRSRSAARARSASGSSASATRWRRPAASRRCSSASSPARYRCRRPTRWSSWERTSVPSSCS